MNKQIYKNIENNVLTILISAPWSEINLSNVQDHLYSLIT